MVIVGISGGSGAGKSTVSRGLAKYLPNAVFIDVDPYFREATEKLRPEVFRRMKVEQKDGVLDQNYYFDSLKNMMIWIDVIKDYVSNRIEEVVAKLGADKEYVIVDWCYLPMCDFFYKCDYTICVNADYETRYKRLANRMSKVKSYSLESGPSFYEYQPKAFANRVKYSAIDEYGYLSKYQIKNDKDMESLNKSVKLIAEGIKTINSPVRYFEINRAQQNKVPNSVGFKAGYGILTRGNYKQERRTERKAIAQPPRSTSFGNTMDYR